MRGVTAALVTDGPAALLLQHLQLPNIRVFHLLYENVVEKMS